MAAPTGHPYVLLEELRSPDLKQSPSKRKLRSHQSTNSQLSVRVSTEIDKAISESKLENIDFTHCKIKKCSTSSDADDGKKLPVIGSLWIVGLESNGWNTFVKDWSSESKLDSADHSSSCISTHDTSTKINGVENGFETKFHCELRDDIFEDNFSLQQHLRTHKNGCLVCSKLTANSVECFCEKHSKKVRLKCQSCNRRFRNPQLLRRHQQQCMPGLRQNGLITATNDHLSATLVKSSRGISYKCPQCDSAFCNFVDFIGHNVQYTPPKPKVSISNQKFTFPSYIITREDDLFCVSCQVSFARRNSCIRHLRRTHGLDLKFDVQPMVCGEKNSADVLPQNPTSTSQSVLFACDMCDKRFPNVDQLKTHNQLHRLSNKRFKCLICSKTFDKKQRLFGHRMNHRQVGNGIHVVSNGRLPATPGKYHKCELCGKAFANGSILNKHNIRHKAGHMFRCLCCNQRFKLKTQLVKHSLLHKDLIDRENSVRLGIPAVNKPNTDNNRVSTATNHATGSTLSCKHCGKVFSSHLGLWGHIKAHRKTIPKPGSPTTTKVVKNSHENNVKKTAVIVAAKKSPEKKKTSGVTSQSNEIQECLSRKVQVNMRSLKVSQFKCELCDGIFTTALSYRSHLGNHRRDGMYLCLKCPQKFDNKIQLQKHKSSHGFCCDMCGKSFKTKFSLGCHKGNHRRGSVYICLKCHREYPDKKKLIRHVNRSVGCKSESACF